MLAKALIGDNEPRIGRPGTETSGAMSSGISVEIGQITVSSPSSDPQAHGQAVAEEIQKHIKAAAASLRREKQP